MKFKRLFSCLALSSLLAVGVGVGIGVTKENVSQKAEAAGEKIVGGQNVFLKVSNTNWTKDSAAFAAYFYNATGNAWSWFDSATSLSADYNVATAPATATGWTGMNVVRMNPNGSDSSNNYLNWNNKWNQTSDLTDFGSNDTIEITGSGWDSPTYTWSSFSSHHTFELWNSVETDGTWTNTQKQSLTYLNSTEGARFYSTNISLTTGMKFDIVRDSAYYYHSDYIEDGGAVGTYFQKNGTGDASVKKGGTFEVYVKIKSNNVWTQVSSATEADTWAAGFVDGLDCAAPYNVAPSNWSTFATSYSGLTAGAKNIMYSAEGSNEVGASNVEKAAFMYDMCVAKYASCKSNKFMVNSSDTPRSAAVGPQIASPLMDNDNNNSIIIVVAVISVTVLAAIGGYFLFRSRKED